MSDSLGILVTNERYKESVVGIVSAALDLGKNVQIFLTDNGSKLSMDKEFLTLISRGARISVCGHSADQNGLEKEKINSLGAIYATQFENAIVAQDSTRYLVF